MSLFWYNEYGDKMKLYLKKLSNDIGDLEYMMYQEIPEIENGAINIFKGKTLIDFYILVKKRVDEEFIKLDNINTPRITYIMYIDDYPVGEIMIRPFLNEYWKFNSGNIGYKIRPLERNKGYGTKMLELGLTQCRKLNMKEVYLQCMINNTFSSKVIQNNNGILINTDIDTLYYKIEL